MLPPTDAKKARRQRDSVGEAGADEATGGNGVAITDQADRLGRADYLAALRASVPPPAKPCSS